MARPKIAAGELGQVQVTQLANGKWRARARMRDDSGELVQLLGGVDDPEIIAKFKGDEQVICRSLFTWVNAGSHSIFDDLDYSPTPSTVESNLRVFRRIFEEHGQIGHYRMMMGDRAEEVSAEEQVVEVASGSEATE